MFSEAARRATALVGDGCVIRAIDADTGELAAVAADHRDARRRAVLRSTLEQPPLPPPAGWLGQALERRHALRLPDLSPQTLAATGLPADERVGDVVIVPAGDAGAAIVAIRDRVLGRYAEAERERIEAIAAMLASCLAARSSPPLPPARTQPPPPAAAPAPVGLSSDSAIAPASAQPLADDQLGRILDVTSTALWVVDGQGRTVYVNGAACELVGWPARDLIGVPVQEFLGRPLTRAGSNFYGSEVCDRQLVRADGSTVWVTATTRPLFNRLGEPARTLYTLTEIADRRRNEVRLRLRLQEREALLELAEAAACEPEAETVLGLATTLITDQLGVEMAAVAAYDHRDGALIPGAARGWPEQLLRDPDGARRRHRLPEASPVALAIASGDPVLVRDYRAQRSLERPRAMAALGVRCEAVVPFEHRRAVITAHARLPGVLDASGLSLLEKVARLLCRRWPERP